MILFIKMKYLIQHLKMYMFIIQELQTSGAQTALVTPATFTDRNQADSAFHTALAAAAVSTVPVHTVMMYDEHGTVLRREFYEHITE